MTAPLLSIPAQLSARASFRVRDLVQIFGLGKSQVHHLVRTGRLAAVKLDGVVLIPRAAVEEYLATARGWGPRKAAVEVAS